MAEIPVTPRSDENGVRFATVATVAATLFFALREATLGAHADDRVILSELADTSYGEVIREPFFHSFYRPVVLLLVKLGADVFGDAVRATRVLHAILLVGTVVAFRSVVAKRAQPLAAAIGTLFVLGSANTFVAVLPFAVGLSDLIVAICFLAVVATTTRGSQFGYGSGSAFPWLELALVATLSKETGLLVALYALVICLRERRIAASFALVTGMIAFVAVRSAVVPHVDFAFDSGYLGEYLDVDALRLRFGDSPGGFYAYNVAATLSSALTSEPSRGYLEASYTDLATIPLATSATLVVGWMLVRTGSWRREHAALVVVLVANAAFGYMYVRPRIVFVATLALGILLTSAIDAALRDDARPLGIPAIAWSRWFLGLGGLVLVGAIVRAASHD